MTRMTWYLLFLAAILLSCSRAEAPASGSATAVAADYSVPAPVVEAPPPPPPPTLEERMAGLSFAQAVVFAKPMMTDTVNELSNGAVLLGMWAQKNMTWEDVREIETSYALVQKDSEEARGLRMCVSGEIVQISVERTRTGKFNDGLIMSNNRNIFRFLTVGSSGDLVEGSRATVCGVVIGKFDYDNSGGGQGHAVQLVGMFDLPENRKP